jgi:uncharacterized membrane protein
VAAIRQTPAGRALLASVIGLAAAVAAGLIILWPSGDSPELTGQRLPTHTESAEVERVVEMPCAGLPESTCRRVQIRIESGVDEGRVTSFEFQAAAPLDPELAAGDQIRVTKQSGAVDGQLSYRLADFERRSPMLWLAIAFAALVIVFGRLRGGLSLVGLLLSLAIVLVFIVPAIGEGESPLAVAIVGSLAVMLTTIALAHGVGVKSLAAMLGTAASLLLVALLALAFSNLAHLTGRSSEQAFTLTFQLGVSLEGLLLAGMVIGALGVLDDVTVSQASTVLALRSANPELRFRSLYRRAIDVGRDHVSAAVNTLILAYVGAALPILLIFSLRDVGFAEAVNFEFVAREVVAMLVGSIGLIAAVPLTTALASFVSLRLPVGALPEPEAAHAGHAH